MGVPEMSGRGSVCWFAVVCSALLFVSVVTGAPAHAQGDPNAVGQAIIADIQQVEALTPDASASQVPDLAATAFAVDDVYVAFPLFIAVEAFETPCVSCGDVWLFFFSGGTYLGAIQGGHLVGRGGRSIQVSYPNYRPSDALCCPSLPPTLRTFTLSGMTVLQDGTPVQLVPDPPSF